MRLFCTGVNLFIMAFGYLVHFAARYVACTVLHQRDAPRLYKPTSIQKNKKIYFINSSASACPLRTPSFLNYLGFVLRAPAVHFYFGGRSILETVHTYYMY